MQAEEHCLVDGWQLSELWSTETLPSTKQFEHWCDFVNQAHLTWNIDRTKYDRFPAFIREGRFRDVRVVNLTSAAGDIRGIRGAKEIARDNVALYNILYIARGSECLIFRDKEVMLNAGSFMLWDSTRPMDFITGENLRQVTLCVEHDRLHKVFPSAENFIGRPVKPATGINRLFVEHILSLDEQFGNLPRNQASAVLDTTIELLALTLASQEPLSDTRVSRALFDKVKRHIELNLQDPDLTIEAVARACSISARHLHRMFSERGISVGRYILSRRLERCRAELASPALQHVSITEIAFRWGVDDSSSFSKAFRREFGISPRDYRKAVLYRRVSHPDLKVAMSQCPSQTRSQG